MADRPLLNPLTWATDDDYTGGAEPATPTKVTPSTGKRAQGWEPIEKPAAQHMNALLGNLAGWADYYRDLDWLNTQLITDAAVTNSEILRAMASLPEVLSPSGPYLTAVGETGNVFFSYDGISWGHNAGVGVVVSHHKALVWSPLASLWILGAAASDADEIMTAAESDATWTARNDPAADANRNGIAESGSIIVMCRGAGGFVTSPDGITWTERTHPATNKNLLSVVWTGSQFVAVGELSTILTSSDGITWTDRTGSAPTGMRFNDVAWDPNASLLCAVGQETGPENGEIFTSPDGITWTQRLSYTSSEIFSIVRVGGALFACGYNTINGVARNFVAKSLDGGINWERQGIPGNTADATTARCVFEGGRFVIFWDDGGSDLFYRAGPRVSL